MNPDNPQVNNTPGSAPAVGPAPVTGPAPAWQPGNMPVDMPPPVDMTPVTPPPPAPTPPVQPEINLEPPPKGKPFGKILFIFLGIVILVVVVLVIKGLLAKGRKSQAVTLIWWGLWEEDRVVKPLIDEYQTQNPKVTIKYVRNSPQDYRERLLSAMAKGQGPDIFKFHNTWVPMLSKELDPVPSSVMSVSDYTQKYYPVIASDTSLGSGFAGLPLGYDGLTLFVNEDLFATAGLQPPKTWVELRETAKKLTRVENDQIVQSGVALGEVANVDHWQDILGLMLIQNRASLTNLEGKKVEDALKFFCVFTSIDNVWNKSLPNSTAYFAGGKLAMYFAPTWRALNIKELNPALNFKAVSLPQLPKEDPDEADVAYATYWLEGVWGRSSNKAAAWEFLKFLSSKSSLEKMYQTAASSRGFGQIYPLMEMNQVLAGHEYLGPAVTLAPDARSWYLASRTFDGPTGINSQIGKYFEDAVNAICSGVTPSKAMESLTPGVAQVLKQYGLTK